MITKNLKFCLFLMLFLGLAACKKVKYQKEVKDYYPKLTTTNVFIRTDGSAKVDAELNSTGSGDLYFIGFCLDTAPNPELHINQQLVKELDGNSFSTVYEKLNSQKNYYVRSFAANEFGYSYGNDLMISHPGPDTNNIPCHPGNNTIMVASTSGATIINNINTISAFDLSTYEMSISSTPNSFSLNLQFGGVPQSGKYIIGRSPSFGSDVVEIYFMDPNRGSYYMDGGEVNVYQIDQSHFKIWICNAKSGEGRSVTASFTTK